MAKSTLFEDQEMSRDVLMRRLGHRVVCARDGQQGDRLATTKIGTGGEYVFTVVLP